MKLLVIGTPHSGTHYMAAVLSAAGLDIGHETSIKTDGLVAWQFGVSSKVPHPKRPGMIPNNKLGLFDVIIHQIRHPLACLRSMHFNGSHTWQYAYENGLFNTIKPPWPQPMDSDLSLMSEFWLRWNESCEKMTDKRIRIEAIEDDLPRLREWTGAKITKEHLAQAKVSDFGRSSNRNRSSYRKNVRWEELADANATLYDRVRAKATEYGYKESL